MKNLFKVQGTTPALTNLYRVLIFKGAFNDF